MGNIHKLVLPVHSVSFVTSLTSVLLSFLQPNKHLISPNGKYFFTTLSIYSEGGELTTVTDHMVKNTQEILMKVKASWPQYELDGFSNVWILKPGAMSRGRGRCSFASIKDFKQF